MRVVTAIGAVKVKLDRSIAVRVRPLLFPKSSLAEGFKITSTDVDGLCTTADNL